MSVQRWIHMQLREDAQHFNEDTGKCWCHPASEQVRVRWESKPQADRCDTPGHLIVQWDDDGAPLYMCDRCGAELDMEFA